MYLCRECRDYSWVIAEKKRKKELLSSDMFTAHGPSPQTQANVPWNKFFFLSSPIIEGCKKPLFYRMSVQISSRPCQQ